MSDVEETGLESGEDLISPADPKATLLLFQAPSSVEVLGEETQEELGPPTVEYPVESLEEMSQQIEDTGWSQDLIGITFGGRYLVERELARGGMGHVYLGRQTNLNRSVVVKVISKLFVDGPEDLQRFEQEAMGLSALQHPNIVTIYDFGAEAGVSYIAMEHIEGETLEDRLARNQTLTISEFLRVAPQILRAIGTAHDQGIIHRDIKPANVMLTRRNHQDDFVKVVDFGLVKLVGSGREITGKGLVGTFGYVSPEQILGEPFDSRSDVYALGVLFYHMLAGRKPFEDLEGMSVLYKHVHEAPPPLRGLVPEPDELPEDLSRLIHQCLEKDPARRPRNANEVLEIMVRRGLVADEDASGPRVTGEHQRSDTSDHQLPRRSLVPALALILALLVLVMITTRAAQNGSGGESAEARDSAVATNKDRVERYLDEAQRLADEKKWAQAVILLRRADDAPGGSAELLARSVELENQIAVGQLVEEARRHHAEGRHELAIRRLDEALKRDSENLAILELLGQIRAASESAAQTGHAEAVAVAIASTDAAKPVEATKVPAGGRRAAKKAEPKTPEAPKEAGDPTAVASPRLPSQLRVQDRRMLEQLLRRVESEATDRNDFRPIEVQNSTRLLFKAAAAELEANKQPTVSPRKIYYLLARGVKAGKSRDVIAAELESAYRAGSLE